jgi:hypothetical protein
MPSNDASLQRELQHVLFLVAPLLNTVKGERRATLQQSFIRLANFHGQQIMQVEDEGRLPTDAREAASALHRAVLELAACVGVERADLVAHYNARAETASFGKSDIDDTCDRVVALTGVFLARKIAAA